MSHAKIVCTIGPASESPSVLKEMIEAGMNVARLNFSHGSYEEHGARIRTIRQVSRQLGREIAILLDTKGPEIRVGKIRNEKMNLQQGQKLILTTEEIEGNNEKIFVSYPYLAEDVEPGTRILLDDGLIELEVKAVEVNEIICEVKNSGELRSNKGINVPGVYLNLPAVTEKDRSDILFGIENGVDFIACSFVRSANDVLEIRRILEEFQADIHIIAKIETRAAVDNIDEILQASDGIMVARGDLGVEIPSEEVPLVQKLIIEKCNQAGKPVITATQMLDSMIRTPRPTRAEASDVANAIFDGTDAIMLSGETAAGKYPVESVSTMARIARRAEEALRYDEIHDKQEQSRQRTITDAIGHATVNIATELEATAIITPTESGSTARVVSKYRPKAKIVAATPNQSVLRKLCLVWGVEPILVRETPGTDDMIAEAVKASLAAGLIQLGDLVVITAGVPVGVPGTTNLLKVHVVGEVVARGMGIGNQVATGTIRLARHAAEAAQKVVEGDILVTIGTDREFIPVLEKVAAIIAEEGGLTSHAAVVGLNLGIPVVVGVEGAMARLEEGTIVTVDATRGLIYKGVTKVF